MATIIDGTAISAKVRERVARGAAEFIADTGHVPGLVTVLGFALAFVLSAIS